MVARTVASGGQRTAERHVAVQKRRAPPAPPSASSSPSSRGLFHTVTASTPRAKRLARVYPHSNATQRWQQQSLQGAGDAGGADDTATTPTRRSSTGSNRLGPSANRSSTASSCVRHRDEDDSGSALLLSLTPTRVMRGSSTGSLSFHDGRQHSGSASDWSDSGAPTIPNHGASAFATGVGGDVQDDILSRIATLKALCDQGFISSDEYERRKCAIDEEDDDNDDDDAYTDYGDDAADTEVLATRLTATQPSRSPLSRSARGLPLIVPHGPNFSDVHPETATKHVFDYATRQWSSAQVRVALDETPFSKGSLRVVYHLLDLSEDDADALSPLTPQLLRRRKRRANFVAKLAIDPDEDPQTYFRDAELQAHCAHYAQLYNSYMPPKRVEFIEAWVLELTERNGALCAVESYIPGEYRKHNNNFGSVSDDERNTPQAFSHFTYEASNHRLLAVDIQGVGDLYTDPQIHTLNGDDFGKGNLGVLGFQKFLSSHRCNSICRYLKLPSVNPKDRHADSGTLPVQELMNGDRVRPTQFDSKHYYENAPMLQKYITQCRELEGKSSRRPQQLARHRKTSASSPPPPSTWTRFFVSLFCGYGTQ
ncbi:hypothetical protein PybrP1_006560 [[Pythium] brassicae (nom. inval.)]|nr:hypothetical protein PybrP1_006560 [[Pythium] brassicae (nom. inval.)]